MKRLDPPKKANDPGRSPAAVIFLHETYNKLTEMDYESAVSAMSGLADILHHNPNFKLEHVAFRRIATGEAILNQLRREAESL